VDELLPAGRFQIPHDVSPDGTTLAFSEKTDRGNYGLSILNLTRSHAPAPLFRSAFDEGNARFSPDGRFIAFASNESGSGRYDVYVAPFPTSGAKVRVSVAGGDSPRWSRDGRELFYLSSDRRLVAVPVRTRPSLELGPPASLFALGAMAAWSNFDVSPDGKRFIAIAPGPEVSVAVLQHWISGVESGKR